ncbi:hypothetical protein DE146DRAFT_615655 [Phaeosphaeria sp. MPI-PUGE-AT-0046c]|nr:hypothetical protein DE146DRAFT_615655 [Phaeosphaeria sp. MPI-PUGE-AT-0046c]
MRKKYSNPSTSATLDTITPTPQRKASALSKRREDDIEWEVRASRGIKTKELSLDRQWNELTWKNKSSCHERLKLLKDDGVDITSLQGPKISSDAITRAVIAQSNERKRQRSSNDNAQSTPPKRKRGGILSTAVVDPSEPHDITDNDEPILKKRCMMDLRLTSGSVVREEEEPTWELLRSKVLRDLFASVPHTEASPAATSRIVISFPSQSSATSNMLGGLVLNSKGYDNIMEDLRILGEAADEDGNFAIRYPFGSSTIRIITSEARRMIIEGKAAILTALIRRFCTPGKGLLHIAKRYFDDEGMRKSFGAAYELGSGTQKELGMIEEELWKAKESGTPAEVFVKWIYVGRTDKWPDKMY